MGVHISFVRSVSLDSWKSEHIRNMQRWGNKRANEYWEYNLPKSYPRPTENSSMADLEKFIKAKYVKKLWVRDAHSDDSYSDYSYSEDEQPVKTTPKTPTSSLSAIRPSTPRTPTGLSSLSKKNKLPPSPMDELFMSLTLKSPASPTEDSRSHSDEANLPRHTGSISSLYSKKSPTTVSPSAGSNGEK